MTSRPFLLTDSSEPIGEIRTRANRLQRLCSELEAELAELVHQAVSVAASPRDDPPALLSVQDCADLLGLSRTTTFSLIREGRIRSIKVGTRRLVPRTAVEQFVAAGDQPALGVADHLRAV